MNSCQPKELAICLPFSKQPFLRGGGPRVLKQISTSPVVPAHLQTWRIFGAVLMPQALLNGTAWVPLKASEGGFHFFFSNQA